MLKYYWVIFANMFRLPHIICKMRRMAQPLSKYTEEERYEYVRYITKLMRRTGLIKTEGFGQENLPTQGGYIMYPNHQGKYDVYGIVSTHTNPCSVVMDKAKSYIIFVNEALELIKGKRLDKKDLRQAFSVINEVAEEVKHGARFILFPEGGYDFNNKNILQEFKAGCFKIALKSKMPIVPVVLIDSYKVFDSYHVGPVKTQVHYLEPILYEEYKDMKSVQIADLVKQRIQDKIDEVQLCS